MAKTRPWWNIIRSPRDDDAPSSIPQPGSWTLTNAGPGYVSNSTVSMGPPSWLTPQGLAAVLAAASTELPAYLTPDEKYPDTMGWRSWNWDLENRRLYSPVMWTPWDSPELHCDAFDSDFPQTWGAGGIHARRVPRAWETVWAHDGGLNGVGAAAPVARAASNGMTNLIIGEPSRMVGVTGIVERFGKYVLGTLGWRSEWAAIRKLRAPSEAVGLDLEKAFPEVEVIYGHW